MRIIIPIKDAPKIRAQLLTRLDVDNRGFFLKELLPGTKTVWQRLKAPRGDVTVAAKDA